MIILPAPSAPIESFRLPGFSFRNIPRCGWVSAELTGVVGGIICMESTLAVRSESDREPGVRGSTLGGGPRSMFGVVGYADSRVDIEGAGISLLGVCT